MVFTLWLGSYYGDWNNESNFLRAALGSGDVLVSMMAGLPQLFLHPMAMGATIGDGLILSQNNKADDSYFPDGQGVNEVHISLLGDPTLTLHPVLPPGDLQAAGGASVQLSWNISQDSNLLGYHIFRSRAGDTSFQRLTSDPVGGTSYTDHPTAGDYVYMVRALKREQTGSGTYLNLSRGVIANASATGQAPQPPATPSNLSANALSPTSVLLSWTDASSTETSFRIERRSLSESQFSEIGNVLANVVTYTDNSAQPATTYRYRIRARNAAGDSAYSAEVQVITGQSSQPPLAPTNLGAIATSYNSVALSWTDGSSNESSFRIERRSPADAQFQEIANVAANITSYTDSSVQPATNYRYRVRARNSVGDSAYSSEVLVTTGAPPTPKATVSYVGQETSLGGNWPQLFGSEGRAIPTLSPVLPSDVTLQLLTGTQHVWDDTTTDSRAVRESATDSARIASAWFDPTAVRLNFSAVNARDVALYFLDWDRAGRIQDLNVLDADTGLPLYQTRIENFADSKYLKFRLQGAVIFEFKRISGPNAVVSALLIGGAQGGGNTAPTLSVVRSDSSVELRLTVPAEKRFVLERSTSFETWGTVSEHQGTGTEMNISRSARFSTEFFRVRMLN